MVYHPFIKPAMPAFFCVYIRENSWLKDKNIVKVGVFRHDQIASRDSTYVTSEPDRGSFTDIWKVFSDDIQLVDQGLKYYLEEDHYQSDGGTEFYHNNSITSKINSFFSDILETEFSHLKKEEIETLTKKKYQNKKKTIKPSEQMVLLKNKIRKARGLKETISLRQFQADANVVSYLTENKKGILNWCPRLGKTIASVDALLKLNCKKVCIGVPTLNLARQWCSHLEKYCCHKIILVDSSTTTETLDVLLSQENDIILVTTYNSAFKVNSCGKSFDIKIADEAHHLTFSDSRNTDRDFRKFHEIISTYSLSLSGSLKTSGKAGVVGNDNTELFGGIIDTKSLSWAIENNLVCDYDVLAPVVNSDRYECVEELSDRYPVELIISCNLMVELIFNEKYENKRILNFVNNIEDSVKCKEIIDIIIAQNYSQDEQNEHMFMNVSISNLKKKEEINVIEKFKTCSYGIISTCYKLGEGTDIKEIDTVCISQAMQAEIRIFQSVLRSHTKDESNPSKKAVILVPIVTDNEYKPYCSDEDHRFDKIRQVLETMAESDENVIQKVRFISNKITKNNKKDFSDRETAVSEELQIMMRLRCMRFGNRTTFNKLRELISLTKRNSSFDLKNEYLERQKQNNMYPPAEQVNKILRNTQRTWFDLYGIDISGFYTYAEFKKKYSLSDKKQNYIDGTEYSDPANPPFADLGDLYGKYGYTDLDWWDNCDD